MERARVILVSALLALAACGGPDPATLPPCPAGNAAARPTPPRNEPFHVVCCRLPNGGVMPPDC